jgi:hypothetical protein
MRRIYFVKTQIKTDFFVDGCRFSVIAILCLRAGWLLR